jgi:hypothetical protein
VYDHKIFYFDCSCLFDIWRASFLYDYFEIIMDDYVFKELSPIIFSKGRGCVGQMMASYILQDLFICI